MLTCFNALLFTQSNFDSHHFTVIANGCWLSAYEEVAPAQLMSLTKVTQLESDAASMSLIRERTQAISEKFHPQWGGCQGCKTESRGWLYLEEAGVLGKGVPLSWGQHIQGHTGLKLQSSWRNEGRTSGVQTSIQYGFGFDHPRDNEVYEAQGGCAVLCLDFIHWVTVNQRCCIS